MAALPALPVVAPVTSASPWRKKGGKALDLGQKKTCGKETRQEWEQVRRCLPSLGWQEIPSPALTMGCHHDWVSKGSANTSTETACPAQGGAFQAGKAPGRRKEKARVSILALPQEFCMRPPSSGREVQLPGGRIGGKEVFCTS